MSNLVGSGTFFIRQNNADIQYSTDKNSWSTLNWPIYVYNNGDYLILEFTTNITITNTNQYFSCISDNIQFGIPSLNDDGFRPNIIINTNYYDGFIENGTGSSNGYNNIYIFNLNIIVNSDYATQIGAGWIGKNNFARGANNNYIMNCSSNGIINNGGGGIVGNFSASEYGDLNIIGCSSSGSIYQSAGGIVGLNAGYNNGTVICQSCFSTGLINNNAGGIFGEGSDVGQIIINHCYSYGSILSSAGGICGANFSYSSGSITINNCYSTGNIGNSGGGIIGSLANNVTISNCYTIGNATSSGAGCIAGETNGSIYIFNCYTTGNVSNNQGYLIGNSSVVPNSCFSEAKNGTPNNWNNVHANSVLTGAPNPIIGNVWVSSGNNQNYKLSNIGYSPYNKKNIININGTISFQKNAIQSIKPGETTTQPFNSGNYSILQKEGGNPNSYNEISIDPQTGVIKSSVYTIPGTYTLYILGFDNFFSVFTLKIKSVSQHIRHLFSNNLVFYKKGSLSTTTSLGVRNNRIVSRKT